MNAWPIEGGGVARYRLGSRPKLGHGTGRTARAPDGRWTPVPVPEWRRSGQAQLSMPGASIARPLEDALNPERSGRSQAVSRSEERAPHSVEAQDCGRLSRRAAAGASVRSRLQRRARLRLQAASLHGEGLARRGAREGGSGTRGVMGLRGGLGGGIAPAGPEGRLGLLGGTPWQGSAVGCGTWAAAHWAAEGPRGEQRRRLPAADQCSPGRSRGTGGGSSRQSGSRRSFSGSRRGAGGGNGRGSKAWGSATGSAGTRSSPGPGRPGLMNVAPCPDSGSSRVRYSLNSSPQVA